MHRSIVFVPFLLLAGCAADADDLVADGPAREVRGGRFHDAPLGAADAPDQVAELLPLVAGELDDVIAPLDAHDFRVTSRRELAGPGGGRLIALSLQQLVDGVPIRGTRLDLTLQGRAGDLVLAASSYRLFPDASVDLAARIGRERAIELARAALRAGRDDTAEGELGIEVADGRLRLAWSVTVAGSEARAVVLAAGADAGRVIVADERRWEADGVVRGLVSDGAPGLGRGQLVPLADLWVRSAAGETATGADGSFILAAPAGEPVTAMLGGRAVRVSNAAGDEVQASAPADGGMELELAASGAEQAVAQTNTYQAITAARRWLIAGGVSAEELGAPVAASVNEKDTCNAYYSTTGRSLHFFRAGGGCRNSAEASIIAHEYGHMVDDAFGGITEDGLSEGWGDLISCMVRGRPEIGADLFVDGAMRSCDNHYHYPRGGQDEVHELGQAWAGFGWHLRAALIDRLGTEAGDARARALLLPVLTGNAGDIPAAVRQVFLLDDDDGNLGNGTPDWKLLMDAAARHDLTFVIGEERGAPAQVRDLAVIDASGTRVTLRWTAPGDDGRTGQAIRYQLRWSERPLTAASFDDATEVPVPAPRPGGAVEQVTVAVPPVSQVWFALRAWDDAGNVSPMSNVVSARPAGAVRLFADGAEHGLGGWAATGLWHISTRAAAEGSHAFWYGDEQLGTYAVDGAEVGALVSPIIDLGQAVAPVLSFRERVDVEDHPERDLTTVTVVDVEDRLHMRSLAKVTGWTDGQFRTRLLDLAPLVGRKVRIEIVFDAVDGLDNARGGWFVDDLQVVADDGPAPPGRLVINEILADPPHGFDANGDGAWSYADDEFLELVNAGEGNLDLGGATMEDAIATHFTFPPDTVIPPGGVLLLFGGGTPSLPDVPALAAVGGLQLNNDGDDVRSRDAAGAVIAEASYGSEAGLDQSLVRAVDGDGTT
ncbi:MAG TPA: lamin tail domain-containing protein, partial [Kofleriaceae bacterium]|nr:lamin tail domain-containing protein [Kofleriaceae bacterium]